MINDNNKKLISIISPCYNEEDNVKELYERVRAEMERNSEFEFECVFIDNASNDATVELLKEIASKDSRVKIIVNTRNFGHIRSPYWGIMQTRGDATIYLASDLQDPPELISVFLSEWKLGYKVVLAVKPVALTSPVMHFMRRMYYRFLDAISEVPIVKDATGFGLYAKEVLDHIRAISDPYPFLRGLICELGYEIKCIQFNQPRRLRGISKNNFYSLFDIAMLGIVSHSMIPIRLASILGFILAFISLLLAIFVVIYKILHWNTIPFGYTPLIAFILFILAAILFFIGMLGEYIGVIHTNIQKRPIVVEKERINF